MVGELREIAISGGVLAVAAVARRRLWRALRAGQAAQSRRGRSDRARIRRKWTACQVGVLVLKVLGVVAGGAAVFTLLEAPRPTPRGYLLEEGGRAASFFRQTGARRAENQKRSSSTSDRTASIAPARDPPSRAVCDESTFAATA